MCSSWRWVIAFHCSLYNDPWKNPPPRKKVKITENDNKSVEKSDLTVNSRCQISRDELSDSRDFCAGQNMAMFGIFTPKITDMDYMTLLLQAYKELDLREREMQATSAQFSRCWWSEMVLEAGSSTRQWWVSSYINVPWQIEPEHLQRLAQGAPTPLYESLPPTVCWQWTLFAETLKVKICFTHAE